MPTNTNTLALAVIPPQRPSRRQVDLSTKAGVKPSDVAALFAQLISEIRGGWRDIGQIGDTSFFTLDFDIEGKSSFVQFWSEPHERDLLCEVSSGYYGDASDYVPTKAQREAMLARGFDGGTTGNFRKELDFTSTKAAEEIASTTLTLLRDVFGWSAGPLERFEGNIEHTRKTTETSCFQSMSRSGVKELLRRHGVYGVESGVGPSPNLKASARGRPYEIRFEKPVDKHGRGFGQLRMLASVLTSNSYSAVSGAINAFNGISPTGRAWFEGSTVWLSSRLSLAQGASVAQLHAWLFDWENALCAAHTWFRHVATLPERGTFFFPHHFNPAFQRIRTVARGYFLDAYAQEAIDAFLAAIRVTNPSDDDESGGVASLLLHPRHAHTHSQVSFLVALRSIHRKWPFSKYLPCLDVLDA